MPHSMRLLLPLAVAVPLAIGSIFVACSSGSHSPAAPGGPGSTDPGVGVVIGQLDAGPAGNLGGTLPMLTNVTATQREDSVGIDFNPVDNAVDYRVYPLPDPADVTKNSDGSITIKNGIYRCAGLRQAYDLPNNVGNSLSNPDAGQSYFNQYAWSANVPSSPTLGYVYPEATAGTVPVYAVAVHPYTDEVGWRETRPKIYTTEATLRATLLTQGGRDDGIVFYVPASSSSTTTAVYHSENAFVVAGQTLMEYNEYYFTSAQVSAHHGDSTPPAPAFQILTQQAPGTIPLDYVLYNSQMVHTELSAGQERFRRAASQGPGPLWHLEWSGITGPTTLVIEALSSGCPFQGFLSPQSVNASSHQPLFTLEQLASASPTSEVYINGQYDVGSNDGGLPLMRLGSNSPIPIARSYVQVTPQPHDPSAWDWYEGFNVNADAGTFTPTPDPASCSCDSDASPQAPCPYGEGACGYWTSPVFNAGAYEVDNPLPNKVPLLAFGQFLGQFWDVFDDDEQDVTGSLRFTAVSHATVDSSTFVHVTFSVDTVTTDRRYPQLIFTDQPAPIEDGFANKNSNFLLVQPIIGPSMRFEAEAFHGEFDGKPWAVNNQAPDHAIMDVDGWFTDYPSLPSIPPADPPFEHAGMDRMTKYDIYVSSNLLYAFMDGQPAGCMQYPNNGFSLQGPVTVTFGDVFYHEGAQDELVCSQDRPYAFMHEHQCTETRRHWDDLGIKSGVVAPAWNTALFPCMAY